MKKGLIKKGDIITAAVILAVCLALFLGLYIFNPNNGNYVQITQKGTVTATLPLDRDSVYDVETGGKITNTVEIKDEAVSVTYASCPDQICANHSSISKTGESIICLPNKVVVSVLDSDGMEKEIDGVAR